MALKKTEESAFVIELKRTLELKEVKLEDGNLVSNKEAICQILIEKALQGNLEVIDLIVKLTK